jgi:exonuclease SbcC
MIEHVKTRGYKGFDIDEGMHPKTILVGPNASGKSSRGEAIALTTLGYIPWAAKASKNNTDILNDFGTGSTLTVAVTCNGVEFERHFSKSEKGSVSQRLRVDKKKYSAADFAVALDKAGSPKIIDVRTFMSLSDQKKKDVLFDIFPPKADLKDLDRQIDKAKSQVSTLQKQERSTTAVIQRLTKSKGEIELPSGSLSEIREEIDKTATQVKTLQEEIKQAEIALAQARAKEKAEENARVAAESHIVESVDRDPGNQRILDFLHGKNKDLSPDPATSIRRIITALEDAGCQICAAAIVAKQELKKYTREAAA